MLEHVTYSDVLATVALCLAMGTLGWTIYRDAVQRPRFRVSIQVTTFMTETGAVGPFLTVVALNLGPLPNRYQTVCAKHSRLDWPRSMGMFTFSPDRDSPFNTAPGTKIEVGDDATFAHPYEDGNLLRGRFKRIGVIDGYGRIHWAPRRQVEKVTSDFLRAFPSADR